MSKNQLRQRLASLFLWGGHADRAGRRVLLYREVGHPPMRGWHGIHPVAVTAAEFDAAVVGQAYPTEWLDAVLVAKPADLEEAYRAVGLPSSATRIFTDHYKVGDEVNVIRDRDGWYDGRIGGPITAIGPYHAIVDCGRDGTHRVHHVGDVRPTRSLTGGTTPRRRKRR
jgi:hypothetical protein